MPPKDKYTNPKLRDQVKKEIQDSDKGGAPGQWSARKAQMMAKEYKNRGGDYNTDKNQKDESQQNLSNWGDEEWQTKEGSGNAKKADGTQKRYLPKKAWDKMSEKEKEETDKKKQKESKEGKQFVGNTDKAKDSRKKASKNSGKDDAEEEENENDGNNEDDEDDGEEEYKDDGEAEDDQDGEEENDEEDEQDDKENAKAGQKRKSSKKDEDEKSSKKQKDNSGRSKSKETVGSKHMDAKEPGRRGSKDRLPKKGDKAQWKAMPGYVDGEVVEVLTKGKTVDGKSVKASKDDPKILLKSSTSGKICVHKPDACFYD